MEKILGKFVNLYELSKTLRFELKPMGKTHKILRDNKIFQKDKAIQDKYKKTKIYLDWLHREFVIESLNNLELSGLEKYQLALQELKKWDKDKIKIIKGKESLKKNDLERIFKKIEAKLRKEVVDSFNKQAKAWSERYQGLKNNDLKILDEKAVFSKLLKPRYGKQDESFLRDKETNDFILDSDNNKISIFDSWEGFTGYFKKFFETRKNFYKYDGTNTAIATRIVNQNLRRFCDNLIIFEKIKDRIDFSGVENYLDISLNKIFTIQNYCNILLQKDIDFYNEILGGKNLDNGEKIQGINELINLYRQETGKKLPFLKKLDKQILGESDKVNFIDEIKDDDNLKNVLVEFIKNAQSKISIIDKLINEFIKNIDDFELDKIYISKEAFNTISRKWTSQTHKFEEALYEVMKGDKPTGLKYNKKEDRYKFPDFIALQYIQDILISISKDEEFWKNFYYKKHIVKLEINDWENFLSILKYEFNSLHKKEIIREDGKKEEIGLDIFLKNIQELLKDFKLTDKSKKIIKPFADNVLHYYQMAKYFSVEKNREWNSTHLELGDFYTNPDFGYEKFYENTYEEIIKNYNKIRNYLTKKPFSEEKWKLNFENPTLAGGWDKNKETDNVTIILRKDEKYFLGLMKKGSNHLFDDKNKEKFEGEGYEKMVYKLLPGANKMLPKVFFSKSNIDFFNPSEKILDIRNYSSHTKGGNPQKGFKKRDFNLKDCHTLIDFFKESLKKHKEWKYFNFTFSDTSSYKNISDFYREVEKGGYKISWENISENYIKEKNDNGELYLFEIHNKDWNLKDGKKKKGTKNLHTLYFESLFSEDNANNDFVMKLGGEAELFFRPKTSKDKLGYRKNKNGEYLINKKGNKVIKNKRYSEDKIFFHLSINLNRNKGKAFGFNKKINNFLVNNSGVNVIGVDRGEKHLAYYSIISQKGKILDSGSLNKISDVDYYAKLTTRAKDREKARKDWQAVVDIKNLKKGYISQVVRKLANLAIKYNAIIVLEDLNMRFKQIRGGIEKSIYQQLEKALIEKLNFLVDKKEINTKKAGNLLKAYQLTAPFETFQKMGKQTGIIFYTQASYTSKIDPLTGWRPNLYLKKGNAEVNKGQIDKFDKIEFVNSRFEFTYNLKNFGNVKRKFPEKTQWTLCSSVERWRWNRNLNNNKDGYNHYENLTKNFRELFDKFNININGDILKQIKELETKGNEKFFSDFIFFWGLVCQIRNTDAILDDKIKALERKGKFDEISEKEKFDVDFILSPVEPFFDSRKAEKFGKNLPKNGDDNGAYNIARKGLVILQEKLSVWEKDNRELKRQNKKEKYYPDLFISSQDWDNFIQK